MPLTLLLRSSSSTTAQGIPALTFDGGRIVIGRGQGCDVRLPDPSVSHRHATVRAVKSEYALVDEKSTNGTFLAGAKLPPDTPHPLKHGDLLRVGRVWLEVRIDQTPATRDLALATRDLALALVSQAMRGMGQEAEIRVRVVDGRDAGASMALEDEGRVYVVGRDASCDLPLADTDVSRAHVHVTRRGGSVLLRDLGSKNGARLGDVRLAPDRDVPWRSGMTLHMGGTVMALEEPAAIALAEFEAAEDEPMGADDVPEEPGGAGDERVEQEGGKTGSRESLDPQSTSLPSSRLPVQSSRPSAGGWSSTDLLVVALALALLGLSIAGLFWLLHT